MSKPTFSLPPEIQLDHPHQVWIIQPPRQRVWLHVLLLLSTFVTTMAVGSRIQYNFEHRHPAFWLNENSPFFPLSWIRHPSELLPGLPFSLTLMFILLAHEMGHYLYARRYRVYATLPYFVPFPSLIGTLGAFIRIKSPITSRTALFDIGIGGPIAGFIPSCVAVFTGLYLSRPIGATLSGNEIGFSIAFRAAAWMLNIHQPLSTVSLHPVAIAGWVGMFATAMNLMPGGQFDGGHILFSVFPRSHQFISLLTTLVLITLSKYFWMGWFLWATFLWVTRRHPPVPLNAGVSAGRKWIAVFGIIMLALSFSPAPIKGGSGREIWPDIRQTGGDSLRSLGQEVRHWLHRK
jgi:Zn-dependent protease